MQVIRASILAAVPTGRNTLRIGQFCGSRGDATCPLRPEEHEDEEASTKPHHRGALALVAAARSLGGQLFRPQFDVRSNQPRSIAPGAEGKLPEVYNEGAANRA